MSLYPETHWFERLSNLSPQHATPPKRKNQSTKENDLINLFDDISISPQDDHGKLNKIDDLQIKQLEMFLSSTGATNLQTSQPFTKEQEKEFQRFLDKYEYRAEPKVFENTTKQNDKKHTDSDFCASLSYFQTPNVLIPDLDEKHLQKPIVTQNNPDEILLKKYLEKHESRGPVGPHNFNENTTTLYKNKNPTSPSMTDIMEQIIQNNHITYTSPNVRNGEKSIKNELHNQHSNIKIKELIMKHNLKYLEAIRMDENKFNKRCLLRSESEKQNLTPGPTLLYKSEVLPQIMKRLNDKKMALKDETNIKRKLILDTDSSYDKLADLPSSIDKHAKGFGLNENQNYYQNQTPQTNFVLPKPDLISATVHDQTSKREAACVLNIKEPVSANADVEHRHSRFIHIDDLRALKKEKMGKEDAVKVGPHVLRAPEILMTDCNKNRFVANATSQLIKDFIFGNN